MNLPEENEIEEAVPRRGLSPVVHSMFGPLFFPAPSGARQGDGALLDAGTLPSIDGAGGMGIWLQ